MNSSTPPVIAFELGVGEFRIVTPEAVYQIKVCHDLVEATRIDDADASGPAAAPSQATESGSPSGSFYQEISEELFDKIGRLARKLSVSVEELPGQLDAPNLNVTDQQLEHAKGQLEEIVKITEQASMTIMDTADSIQSDMDELQNQLGILQNLDLVTTPGAAAPDSAGAAAAPAAAPGGSGLPPAFFEKLGELQNFIESRLHPQTADAAPAAEAAAPAPAEPEPAPAAPEAPATQTVSVTRFDVDVVFQTLYELCTNESVKDHIKAMREAQEAAFNIPAIADHLSELAPTVDEEDGFFNFPIATVLKTLYGATASEDFRTILKKMNQTAASIFLDTVLPIEGEITEVEVPLEVNLEAEPEPAAPPSKAGRGLASLVNLAAEPDPAVAEAAEVAAQGCSPDDLTTIAQLAGELERLASSLGQYAPAAGEAAPAAAEGVPLYTPILTRDRDTIVATVAKAHSLIQQTGAHLTRIMEALSFQDLSGQRIMKVVTLIGDVQMQLLSILVSVNTKLKIHKESGIMEAQAVTPEMAQAEVDKALEKVSGPSALNGPGAEARLDQGAVNDLLAQLGF
ncbi:MAG: protein phosphatase CheZ [Candidatus Adiutrix sp.]|jgi:chemotaxis regulatin CheY-phosphate phosphatase CheZ|nr:protein phosphatase CheZ [Candidatus Adiutrix sp.]